MIHEPTNGAREQRVIVLTVWKVGGALLGMLIGGVVATWAVSNAMWAMRSEIVAQHTEIAELRLAMATGFDQVRGSADDRWRKRDMAQYVALVNAMHPDWHLPEIK